MRMRPDEKCIVPDCDEAGGAKPIYIRVTVDGKRGLKKVGALCKQHLTDAEETDRWLPSAVGTAKDIMSWLVSCPADDINFKTNLQKAGLPLLRRVLERLEDELRRGLPHKTRIKKVGARIRALEKDLLKEDAESNYESSHGSIVDQVLPRKKKDAKLSTEDWRKISELGKAVLPGTEKVHCDTCDCDNVPDRDKDGRLRCGSCDALIEGEEP